MQAVVYSKYGPPEVLQLKEVAKPAPGDDDVLIQVFASSVNARDWRLMRANPFFIRLQFGLFRPQKPLLGADIAGRVEAVGRNVKQFRPGDEVFGYLSSYQSSAFAEYACAREHEIVLKPARLTFEEAAAVPLAAVTALQGLRNKGVIQQGQKVAIQGASGGVGTFAVQLAKAFGAEVTATCSQKNLEMVRTLGADQVIDYTKEDFTRGGQCFDLILAVNGYHPIADYRRVLSPAGSYVLVGGSMRQYFEAALQARQAPKPGQPKVSVLTLVPDQKDLSLLKELLEAGKIKPVIDRSYPLRETAEAIRYVETIHPAGKVVISMNRG